MSVHLERALAVLDVGLQRPGAGHHGQAVAADRCVRCQIRPPVEGTAWCAGCPDITVEQLQGLADTFAALAAEIIRTVVPVLAGLHKALVDAGLIGTVTAGHTYTCPRHGPQGTAFCGPCNRGRDRTLRPGR